MIFQDKPKKIIAIVGPTGSGKTSWAVRLGQELHGVIISADSRQVYRGLDVGTNKEGEKGAYHGLRSRVVKGVHQLAIDCTEPGTRFSLVDWLVEARSAYKNIISHGDLPILVGGTGLYVTAFLEGYDPPDQAENDYDGMSLPVLQSLVPPDALNPSDYANPTRLKNFLRRNEEPRKDNLLKFDSKIFFIKKDREELVRKASLRFDEILPRIGQEIETLLSDGVSRSWIESLGLDYRYALRSLSGGIEEISTEYRQAVRQFIRRQETWWRHHGTVAWVSVFQECRDMAAQFLKDS